MSEKSTILEEYQEIMIRGLALDGGMQAWQARGVVAVLDRLFERERLAVVRPRSGRGDGKSTTRGENGASLDV